MNPNKTHTTLNPIQINPGIKLPTTGIIGIQPPKNKIIVKADIRIMFEYSPKKNKANPIAEYSVKYPATSSASASGKSKGARLVSARMQTSQIIIAGNKGTKNHTPFCASTISVKLRLPTNKKIRRRIKPIPSS